MASLLNHVVALSVLWLTFCSASASRQCSLSLRAARSHLLHHRFDAALHRLRASGNCTSAARLRRSILISVGRFKQALALTPAGERVQRNRLWQLHRQRRAALALVDVATASNETLHAGDGQHRRRHHGWRWSEPNANQTVFMSARDALGGVLAVAKAAASLRLLRAELSLRLGDWHAALADSAWLLHKGVTDHDGNEARAERVLALARYALDGRAASAYVPLLRACTRAAGSAGSSAAACTATLRWARELRCAWKQARAGKGGVGSSACAVLHSFASGMGSATNDALVGALGANCGHDADHEAFDPIGMLVCEPVQLPGSGHEPASTGAALGSALVLQRIMALHGINDIPAQRGHARQRPGRAAVTMPSLLMHPFRCAACHSWSEVHLSDGTFKLQRSAGGDASASAGTGSMPAQRAVAASATCASCAACITAWETIASERERAGSRLSTGERCSMAEAFLSRAWAALDHCGDDQNGRAQSVSATQYALHAVSLGAGRECKNHLGPRSHLASAATGANGGDRGNVSHAPTHGSRKVPSSPHTSQTVSEHSSKPSTTGPHVDGTLRSGDERKQDERGSGHAEDEEDEEEEDEEEVEWRREAAEAMAELRRAIAQQQQRKSGQSVVEVTAPVANTTSSTPAGEPTAVRAPVPQLQLGDMLRQLQDRIDEFNRRRRPGVEEEQFDAGGTSDSEQGRDSSRAPTPPPPPQPESKRKRCHYSVLGVAPNATEAQIRKAFRKLALELHPDKQRVAGLSLSADEAKRLFLEANEAHRVLIDPDLRRKYDMTRGVGDTDAARHERWHDAASSDDQDALEFRYSYRRSGVNRTGDGFVVAWATHRRTGERHRAHFRPPATSLAAVNAALQSSVGEPGVRGARWRCATAALLSDIGNRWRRQQQVHVDEILSRLAEHGVQALPASAPALKCISSLGPRSHVPGGGDDEFQFDPCMQVLGVSVDAGVRNATFTIRLPTCASDVSNQTRLVAYVLQAGSALKAVRGTAPEVPSRGAAYWFCRGSALVKIMKPNLGGEVLHEEEDDLGGASEHRVRIVVGDLPPATRFRGFHVAMCAAPALRGNNAGPCEAYDPRFCIRAVPVAPFTTKDVGAVGTFPGTGFLGGGWRLVRRVGPGSRWHPASDNLQGTEEYGVPSANPQANETFSVRWHGEHVDEVLFSSGDGTEWLVVSFAALGAFLQRRSRWPVAVTLGSSSMLRAVPYEATWLLRPGSPEDPQVSIGLAGFEDAILYAEAGASVELLAREHARRMGGRADSGGKNSRGYIWTEDFLRQRNGANVWIRTVRRHKQ